MKLKFILAVSVLALIALGAFFMISSSPETTYAEYLQQGIDYESSGDLDKALASYEQAAKTSPKEYVPYSNIGSIYRNQKDFVKAEESFKKALAIDPQAVSVYRKLYDLYRYDFRKHPDFMMPFFADILKTTNNNFDVVKLYAFYLEDINDPEPALALWRAFLEVEPDNQVYIDKVKLLEAKTKAQ
ncbi:MAG: hypothetical protein A3B23_01555 [Candidatus Colwellbacteria bacterium RIFCSPLOWO2_01_FULL_48_10]|uniref:Uncharacterized protein n=1 Tax=Candidatus Colwellbacteria bacterium RIFCSPLOWO2_01_FULL_48_10 TaxID=1797690 RepID=A0A1G1Z3I8_9BACT|nr:MAG: hypothetical protein A3B23_01555 [Candidatus Colwellbacteria bacterium RIFCSPLOWO2_01_FULL_48_10]